MKQSVEQNTMNSWKMGKARTKGVLVHTCTARTEQGPRAVRVQKMCVSHRPWMRPPRTALGEAVFVLSGFCSTRCPWIPRLSLDSLPSTEDRGTAGSQPPVPAALARGQAGALVWFVLASGTCTNPSPLLPFPPQQGPLSSSGVQLSCRMSPTRSSPSVPPTLRSVPTARDRG